MGKATKATKKFQSKHLKRVIDHRRKVKEHKKRIQGRRGNKSAEEKAAEAGTKDDQKLRKSAKEEVFSDMSVGEFFDKGFSVPKKLKKSDNEQEEGSESSDEEVVSDSSSASLSSQSSSSSREEIEDEDEDAKAMATSMANLAKNDPEFYNYLKENDKDLLEFEPSNPLDAIESGSQDEEESGSDEEGEEEAEKTETKKIELTSQMVKQWKEALSNSPDTRIIKNVTSAFKAAVHINTEDESSEYKYSIVDERVFQELMIVALKDLPKAVQKLVPYRTVRGSRALPSNKNVSRLSSIIKSHASSFLLLLGDNSNTKVVAMTLHSVNELLPFLLSFRRILKLLVAAVVQIWATTMDIETQVATFAFLFNSAKEFKKSLLEIVLKATYSTFIKNCRKTNIRTMPLLNFQKNSAAELFTIDEIVGYQIGFEYIRQLAIHLRNTMNSITKKTNKVPTADACKVVYNWQFCHSLDFWSRVLSYACNNEGKSNRESPLRQLVYPLIQVTIGVARLVPTPQFFPLRFYLVKSLIRLSQNTGVFIPILPILTEILSSTAFTKQVKKGANLEAFDFDHNIKCSQGYLGTRVYQEGLSEQLVDLLAEYFTLYCKSVSFPELVTPAIITLRRYMKTSKNIKLNKRLSNIVEKLQQNSAYIMDRRELIDFSPSNRTEVNKFLADVKWENTPLGAYTVVQREVKEEKARLMRESLEEADLERENAKKLEDGWEDENSDIQDEGMSD